MIEGRAQLMRDTYAAFHAMRLESLNNPVKYRALVKAQNRCITGIIAWANVVSRERLKEVRGY